MVYWLNKIEYNLTRSLDFYFTFAIPVLYTFIYFNRLPRVHQVRDVMEYNNLLLRNMVPRI